MFCKKCGSKINDTWDFCGSCGERVERVVFDSDLDVENSKEPKKSLEIEDANIEEQIGTKKVEETDASEEQQCTENTSEKKDPQKETIFSKIWNSAIFTMIAMKFGIVVDIVEIIICLFLGVYLLGDGISGNILGILFCACAVSAVVTAVKRFLKREKKVYTAEDIKAKKKNLCIGIVVIIIAAICFIHAGGGSYYKVKEITFDNFGENSVGEVIEKNIKNPEWSKEKLDLKSELVFVEGYCPYYGEPLRITYYCEDVSDGYYEVTLQKIVFVDSGEAYSDIFNIGLIWGVLDSQV